jgi:hypothetical protein
MVQVAGCRCAADVSSLEALTPIQHPSVIHQTGLVMVPFVLKVTGRMGIKRIP